MAITDTTWYVDIQDVHVRALAESFPLDFDLPLTRALVLGGPATRPFGSTLSQAGILSVAARFSITPTIAEINDSLAKLAGRGITDRVIGPQRNLYVRPDYQVSPYADGVAISDFALDPRVQIVRGPQGARGIAGERGTTGAAGPAGAIGPAGPRGAPAELSSEVPPAIAFSGVAGTVGFAARGDHTHAHGDQEGGSLHALAGVGHNHGFMSASDKDKLDGIDEGAVAIAGTDNRIVRVNAPDALQDSSATLDDAGNITGLASIDASGQLTLTGDSTNTFGSGTGSPEHRWRKSSAGTLRHRFMAGASGAAGDKAILFDTDESLHFQHADSSATDWSDRFVLDGAGGRLTVYSCDLIVDEGVGIGFAEAVDEDVRWRWHYVSAEGEDSARLMLDEHDANGAFVETLISIEPDLVQINGSLTVESLGGTGVVTSSLTSGDTRLQGMINIEAYASPAALSLGNNDNYDPGVTWPGVSVLRMTPNAGGSTITGLDSTGVGTGYVVLLVNLSSTVTITIAHEDGNSTAANRFVLANAANLALRPHAAIMGWYDVISSRWRLLSP